MKQTKNAVATNTRERFAQINEKHNTHTRQHTESLPKIIEFRFNMPNTLPSIAIIFRSCICI